VLPPPAPQELSPAKAQQQELCAALDGLPESMQKMLVTQLLSNITCLQAANLAACSPSPSCSSPPPNHGPCPPPHPRRRCHAPPRVRRARRLPRQRPRGGRRRPRRRLLRVVCGRREPRERRHARSHRGGVSQGREWEGG
jgi:hypothetical protein